MRRTAHTSSANSIATRKLRVHGQTRWAPRVASHGSSRIRSWPTSRASSTRMGRARSRPSAARVHLAACGRWTKTHITPRKRPRRVRSRGHSISDPHPLPPSSTRQHKYNCQATLERRPAKQRKVTEIKTLTVPCSTPETQTAFPLHIN